MLDTSPIATVKRYKVDVSRSPRFCRQTKVGCERPSMTGRNGCEASVIRRTLGERPAVTSCCPTCGHGFADHLKPLVIVSLNTGMRRGELFALTWESIDLQGARITVHGTTAKSGRTRHIPLNAEALDILRGRLEQSATASGLCSRRAAGRP